MDKSKCLLDILETIISYYPNFEKGQFSVIFSKDYGNLIGKKLLELVSGHSAVGLYYYYKDFQIHVTLDSRGYGISYQIGIYRR